MDPWKASNFLKRKAGQELPKAVLEEHVAKLKSFVIQHKDKSPPRTMPEGKLRVFADCAGISSETVALHLLGFDASTMEFVGGSEFDPVKRCLMQAVHRVCRQTTHKENLDHDIFDRNVSTTPESDIYISGFPCPAYSSCGVKKGAKDGKGRGLLIFEGLRYVDTENRPWWSWSRSPVSYTKDTKELIKWWRSVSRLWNTKSISRSWPPRIMGSLRAALVASSLPSARRVPVFVSPKLYPSRAWKLFWMKQKAEKRSISHPMKPSMVWAFGRRNWCWTSAPAQTGNLRWWMCALASPEAGVCKKVTICLTNFAVWVAVSVLAFKEFRRRSTTRCWPSWWRRCRSIQNSKKRKSKSWELWGTVCPWMFWCACSQKLWA